jgi:hypothetical protein
LPNEVVTFGFKNAAAAARQQPEAARRSSLTKKRIEKTAHTLQ